MEPKVEQKIMIRQPHQLTDSERELLNIIGKYPEMSMKELFSRTSYKWISTIAKKLERLKELGILFGPAYYVDYGKLCKNPLHRLLCIIELNQSYEAVIEYLTLIEPLVWVFPVLSPHKDLLTAGFFSSNDKEVRNLLQMLKDNNIISDYIIRVRRHQNVTENPNFFGDSTPSLDNLLDPCDLPDISFGHHNINWTECDIRTLSYLQRGFRGAKLMEILKEEKRVHQNMWTYEQIRYSYMKMIRNGLIEKKYAIYPFLYDQCAHFELYLKTEDSHLTQRILHNFARGGRVYKEYMLCDDWGMIDCISHPLFLLDLMHKLDSIDQIKGKEIYHIRSIHHGVTYLGQFSEFKYFDVDSQTLEYPYRIFKEKITERLESEGQR